MTTPRQKAGYVMMGLAFLLAIMTFVLSGCVSSHRTVVLPDGASEKDSLYVTGNAVYVGMPKEYAIEALGTPDDVSANGDYERWQYWLQKQCFGSSAGCRETRKVTVVIEDGQVDSITNAPGWMVTP